MNKNCQYFPHDYNSRTDPKLVKLAMKLGMEGIGIYWCIIEILYEQNGYVTLDNIEAIAFELHTECDRIKNVLQDFNLFKFKDERFFSESILRRLKERKSKSEKTRKSAETRWNKVREDDTNALQSQSECNAIKEKESKVNKRKEKKIEYTEFVSMLPKEYEKLIQEHGEADTKIFIEILNNYKGAKGIKYKSDYLAILNWVIDKVKKERLLGKSLSASNPKMSTKYIPT